MNHVSKKYDKSDAYSVHDIHLEVEDREFMVFVGPSGCGKSTTLRMIAGLEQITSGDIYIGSRRVNDMPPKKRDIAMVFQNYSLYPNMSVFENIAFGMRLRKMEKHLIESTVKSVSRTLEIEHLLERRPGQLSGGQKQRVALGRAIIRQPQVFLMDEPLSNLDARLRVQMRTEIVELHRRLQTTMIYVTHDQTEAMTMGTRICVMNKGVVQQVDTPENVYNQPVNMFVAGFIGSPPMNFLEGSIVQIDGRPCFRTNRFTLPVLRPLDSLSYENRIMGREAVLGIRPEYVVCTPSFDSSTKHPVGIVMFSELMGADRYLHLSIGEQKLAVRVAAYDNYPEGTKLELQFMPEYIVYFHKESGDAIQ